MNQKQLWLLGIIISFIACQNQPTKNTQADTSKNILDSSQILANSLTGCYEYSVGRDTIRLSLKVNGTKVNGDLLYDMYEKDKSKGTLDGTIQDSLLITNYSFNSEGMDSETELFFQFKNDSLYMGEGPQTLKDGKGIYSDRSKIVFKTAFRKISCP